MSLEGAEGAFFNPEPQADMTAAGPLTPRDFPTYGDYWAAQDAARRTYDFSHVAEAAKGPRRVAHLPENILEQPEQDPKQTA